MSELNLKTKVMLNTKDMQVGSGKARPVLGPGNREIKINRITYDVTPYDKDAFNIMLHVEGRPEGGDFEGFLRDQNNESLGRYEGQVGRVRMSPYPFKDATLPSGREINKDQEVLKSMIFLGEVLNMRDDLDSIEAETIEDFMNQCNTLFTNGEKGSLWINSCLASREWENKEGYVNNDLYIPRISKDGVGLEGLNAENSRLLTFDASIHVRPVAKKQENTSFEPKDNGSPKGDFEL
jgi:hypothetical protein